MQRNNFFSGHNYSTVDLNSEANRSFWPFKDTDMILTRMSDGFSFSYRDLYLRHFKELLKQTMLKHEAVFGDQIRELHRLYWRQKELMMEMELSGLSQTSSQHNPRNRHIANTLWLNPCISTQDHTSVRVPEFSANEDDKPGKVVVELELPACEYLDIGEEGSLREGKAHKIETSTRNIALAPDFHSNCLHHSTNCISRLNRRLDLNEPVETEETSDLELESGIQAMPSGIVEESCPQNDVGAAENGPQEINEARVQLSSEIRGAGEEGIDLNTSPTIHDECKQTQESLSASLHGKHGLTRSSKVVQALPCFNGVTFSRKCSKTLTSGYWSSEKAKCGPKETNVAGVPLDEACKGSELDLNLVVPEIGLQAPVSPDNKESARPSAESDNNRTSAEKESPSSLVDIDSLQKTNPKNIDGDDRTGMASYNSPRNNLENRGSLLATEEEEQERTAAEAIVDISSSSAQTLPSVAFEKLHWFAEIASSIIEDSKSEFGLSTSGCPSSNCTDYFEVMTLHLTEMKTEEHYSAPKSNLANQETTISSLAFGRPRRGRGRQRKRQNQDFQHNILPSLASLSRTEVSEDLQTIEGLMEANGTKRDNKCAKNKVKNGVSARGRRRFCSSTPPKAIDTFVTSSNNVEEKMVIDWGTITRRRRGPKRIPAANFHLILSQV